MKSNWEITRARSKYHFDTRAWDPRWDGVVELGSVPVSWQKCLPGVIDAAYPVSWRTRGRDNDPLKRAAAEYDQEEYDLGQIGMPRDYKVTDLNYTLPAELQTLADQFALDQCMARVHVQRPGQVWNLHLDKLEKWMPADPTQVVRYFVQLTDWQQGHFWSYGNYTWWGWRAGNVTTFDWLNVPHSTANAGHTARATLQVTGIKTSATQEFLDKLKYETT